MFLMIGFFLLVSGLASVIGIWLAGWSATTVIVAASISLIMIFFVYLSSTRIALSLNHAQEVTYEQAPQLHNLVEEVALAAGIPKPRVYIVQDPALNAFATGRSVKEGHVAFTTGILAALDREQLQGVVAHEISHIKNEDIRLMTVAAAAASVIVLLAEFGMRASFFGGSNKSNNNSGPAAIIMLVLMLLGVILAPIAAMLIQASISRSRESLADASAVEMTRNPVGMRRALETLSTGGTALVKSHDGTAHMWMGDPLRKGKKRGSKMNALFATHPPLEERIAALRLMGG